MFDYAVLIAATELQPSIAPRFAAQAREVLAFNDSDALRALQTIASKRPGLVVLERGFGTTARGLALINRIKADPTLSGTTIEMASSDASDGTRQAPVASAEPVATPPTTLDRRGTRRAPRFSIDGPMDVLVDGSKANLVNLSRLGAQVLTSKVLKPNQRVRVSLQDDKGTLRLGAVVVWAIFEMPQGVGPRYRVGVDFVSPNTTAIDDYIGRHKGEPV